MLLFAQIVALNSKISLVLGGFLNFLLIFLVFRRTPKEMAFYSKIVLQTCYFDLINLVVMDLVQPILVIYNGIVSVLDFGIAAQFPYPWNHCMFYLWEYTNFAALYGIIVQFAYRYMILCRGWKVTTTHYFIMLSGIATYLAILFYFAKVITLTPDSYIIEDPFLLNLLGYDKLPPLDSNFPTHLHEVIRSRKGDIPWVLWHIFFITTSFGGYLFIGFFGFEMVMFTRKNLSKTGNSESRTDKLNKQLTLNLIVQACIPLCAIAGWIMCSYVCIFAYYLPPGGMNYPSLLAYPVQCWISVINPMATMLILKPYRRALIRLFFGQNRTAPANMPARSIFNLLSGSSTRPQGTDKPGETTNQPQTIGTGSHTFTTEETAGRY